MKNLKKFNQLRESNNINVSEIKNEIKDLTNKMEEVKSKASEDPFGDDYIHLKSQYLSIKDDIEELNSLLKEKGE